jgi:alkylation response protein AidB-like acyl-CoA dehydrogenase
VQALCAEFPGDYWREKDRERAYPGEFVDDALTKAGFLAALIPEEFGGSGLKLDAAAVIMEEIQASGWQRRQRCHAQMYIDGIHCCGTASAEQKAKYLPGIASGELRPAGVRRQRTDQRHRYALAAHASRSGTATIT